MLKKRIIPCLDIRDGQVTKGIEFKGNIDLGDPVPLARRYYAEGADEIVIYDITASLQARPPDAVTVARIAEKVFIPICVGGGIQKFEDAALVIKSGAEKVSLNSVAPQNPGLLTEISAHFGRQAVVLSLDVARDSTCPSGYRLFIQGGRRPTEWDMLNWLHFIMPFGVGEVCLNSIDEDGKRQGYDLVLLNLARKAVDVPIIISGGAGTVEHMALGLNAGADGALVASLLHIDGYSCDSLKDALAKTGIAIRQDRLSALPNT